MSRENVDVIKRLFALVDERASLSMDTGVRQYLELHAPEVVITEAASLPYGGVHEGPEGVKRHAIGFMMTWDRFQPGPTRGLEAQLLDAGEHVVALWRHRAVKPSGERIDLPAVSVYKVQAGRIVESQMFHSDTAALVRFLSE